MTNVPFVDLIEPHRGLREELLSVFTAALDSGRFVGGDVVTEFEAKFSEFCGTRYCVGVGSGTDAVRFALIAAGVKAGDTVVTTPNTFIATAESITQAGARPAFVDVDESTLNLDPRKLLEYLERHCQVDAATGSVIERATGNRVSAIVPVHLYGTPADMDAIVEIADHYRLVVIEDASQAHGASYYSRRDGRWNNVGSVGKAGAFSFYPGKNLGACGEAGAVTTSDLGIAKTVRMLRDHGQSEKHYHEIEGYNGRLDSIQAGILLVKLKHLPTWTAQRRSIAEVYREHLLSMRDFMVLPPNATVVNPVYHLFVIQTLERDALSNWLTGHGVGNAIHYPSPLHLQPAYKYLGLTDGAFPVAERAAGRILSLPMYPQLDPARQGKVVEAIKQFFSGDAVAPRLSASSAS